MEENGIKSDREGTREREGMIKDVNPFFIRRRMDTDRQKDNNGEGAPLP